MYRSWMIRTVLFLAICCCAFACSKEKEAEPEAGAVKQFTEKTATQIEEKIRTPIDKAKGTQELGDERLEAIDEALKKK